MVLVPVGPVLVSIAGNLSNFNNDVEATTLLMLKYGSEIKRYSLLGMSCRTVWGGGLDPLKYVGGVRVCLDTPKMSNSFIQNCYWITLYAKFHIIKDEILVSKMEGKTGFSRGLKQFDGLT